MIAAKISKIRCARIALKFASAAIALLTITSKAIKPEVVSMMYKKALAGPTVFT